MQSVFEDIQFPAYRKYKNNKHFFKILSESAFEETQLIGSKKLVTTHTAKILPDRNFIYDLCFSSEVITITEAEYNHLI